MANADTFDQSCPLRGAVICCTSIPAEKRTELAERAEEMGAKHVYDLTTDVTHLIVAEYNTPKYRYVAKERPDVLVLDAGWVDAVRELWIADQKIDLEALERKHTLPTFATLKISVTGFEDRKFEETEENDDKINVLLAVERKRITELIEANGAEYHANLTKEVTHLLAQNTASSKYRYAISWKLCIVSIEWLHDCIERGMILDENLYNPSLAVEKRGKDAWNRQKSVGPIRKRARVEDIIDEGRRKLRRTTSTRLNEESQKMLADIVSNGAPAVTDSEQSGEWDESQDAPKRGAGEQEAIAALQEVSRQHKKSLFANLPEPEKPRSLFTGQLFFLHGFSNERRETIEGFLVGHDGKIAPTMDVLEDRSVDNGVEKAYIVIPYNLPISERPQIPETLSEVPLVTEIWVERCYFLKSVQDPAKHPIGRPFPKFPIPAFSNMIICSTAFTGLELLHLSKAVTLLGAKYNEFLTPEHSVLICASSESLARKKFDYSQEWKIPVVSPKWLWDSIAAGERLSFKKYRYRARKENPAKVNSSASASTVVSLNPAIGSVGRKSSGLSEKASMDEETDTTLEIKTEDDSTSFDNDNPNPLPENPSPNRSLTEKFLSIRKSGTAPTTTTLTEPVPAPPSPVAREDIDNAITSLLAKSKPSSDPAAPDPKEVKKPKKKDRLLGRAASNMSATSVVSFDGSVDSTATHGTAVHWVPKDTSKDSFTTDGDTTNDKENEVVPPNADESESQGRLALTQKFEWEEEESREQKDRIMARVLGKEEVSGKKGGGRAAKQRAVTLGDINETPRSKRSGLRGKEKKIGRK